METALTYTLQRVHWQFFGSLTFKSVKVPERVRVSMFFALVRCLCRWHKVPFRKCVWALRQEPGEISGRLHFHFLIAGCPRLIWFYSRPSSDSLRALIDEGFTA